MKTKRIDVSPELAALAGRVGGVASRDGTADALHTSALIDFLWGARDRRALDGIVRRLELALLLSPDSTELLGDLAAIHLERALQSNSTLDLLTSVEYAAIEPHGAPRSVAAQFNLALALEALGMGDLSIGEWETLLRREPDGIWSEAGRERLDRLRYPATSRGVDAQVERVSTFDSLLAEWGRAELARDTIAARTTLEKASETGIRLERTGGDASVVSAVRAIANAPDDAGRRRLALAHAQYGAGVRAYRQLQYERADTILAAALPLAAASPALVSWCAFYREAAKLHVRPAAEARTRLLRFSSTVDSVRFPALMAHLRWAQATTALRGGDPHEGAKRAKEAQVRFASINEDENLGATKHIEASALFEAAAEREMYNALGRASRVLGRFHRSSWRRSTLWVFAAAVEKTHPRAAAYMRDVSVTISRALDDRTEHVTALVARGRSRLSLGDTALAIADHRAADSLLRHVEHGAAREWAHADLLTLAAAMGPHSATGVARLDSAVRLLERAAVPSRLLSALVARATLRERLGHADSALADLSHAAEVAATIRSRLLDRQSAADFVAAIEQMHDRRAAILLARGDHAGALIEVERRRELLAAGSRAGAFAELATRGVAPRGVVVLDFYLAGDSLLVWHFSSEGRRFLATVVDRDALLGILNRVRQRMERGATAATLRDDLVWLHEVVVRPALPSGATADSSLHIVADGELANLPFAATIDRQSGRHLVERWSTSSHRSLREALRPSAAHVREPVLAIIADPAFDSSAFPELSRLPAARAEAESLAALYPRVTILTDDDARPSAVAEAVARATVVHVAAHVLFNERAPDASILVLGKARTLDRLQLLNAAAARELDLGREALVVLASCRSGERGSASAAAVLGFASAFRDAGARGVLGALWLVEDRTTADFMIAFHRSFRSIGRPDAALRAAQLEFLRSSRSDRASPSAWAAYTYSGT